MCQCQVYARVDFVFKEKLNLKETVYMIFLANTILFVFTQIDNRVIFM